MARTQPTLEDRITAAVREAVAEAMPDKDEILAAIQRGVASAFPFSDVTAASITEGIRESLSDLKIPFRG